MRTLFQDIRYGFRMLARNPVFTVLVVLILALGIGANTAIFSVVNAILIRPLPYHDPGRLVVIWGANPQKSWYGNLVSFPNFQDWKNQNQVFENIAACRPTRFILMGKGQAQRIQGDRVSSNLFRTLGVQAVLGRTFSPDEENSPVVVLSYGLWQRRFGSDPSIIGQTLILNSEPFTIIGVMPPDFWFPVFGHIKADQLWMPLEPTTNERNRKNNCLVLVGRLRPDVTLEQAQAEMDTISRRLEQEYPDSNTGWTANLVRAHQQVVGNIRPALLVLLGAVGFVLLIACANVANLLLIRATARQREIAIRSALGAGRLRLARQLVTESILLAALAGLFGLLLAFLSIDFISALKSGSVPRLDEVTMDHRVLTFTAVVSLLTGLVFGLVPALQAAGIKVSESFKEGRSIGTGGFRGQRARNFLMISEVALALVLLIGAGLMSRSLACLMNVNPGYDSDSVLTMQIQLPEFRYTQAHQRTTFLQQVTERIEVLPGVQYVGIVNWLPLFKGSQTLPFTIEGQATPTSGQVPTADCHVASPHYFRAIGIRLLKGREFTEKDGLESPRVVIINETLASRHFPDEEAIGQRLNIDGSSCEVVGIVGDVKHGGLDGQTEPEAYWPYLQYPWPFFTLVVRTASHPEGIAAAVQNEIWAVDKDIPITGISTLKQQVSASITPQRLSTFLFGTFGAAALVLATVGLYGVIAYSVSQRTHEIGIRVALGAQTSDVVKLVLHQGLRLALIGVVIGLVAAFALSRFISSLLYNVSATDPVTFSCVSLVLVGAALLASYIPARRAASIDPMVALRYE